jgi:hypothetical protein
MQEKTDGRVVRFLTKHVAAEGRSLEQWFLVAIGDDQTPRRRYQRSTDDVVEVVGRIPASNLASWGLTDGEVRLVIPGEPISD